LSITFDAKEFLVYLFVIVLLSRSLRCVLGMGSWNRASCIQV